MTPLHLAVLEALSGGGALFFRMLGDRVVTRLDGELPTAQLPNDGEVADAIWDLVWPGCSPTTRSRAPRAALQPAAAGGRARTGRAAAAPRRGSRSALRLRAAVHADAHRSPTVSGRWSLLPGRGAAGAADGSADHGADPGAIRRCGRTRSR